MINNPRFVFLLVSILGLVAVLRADEPRWVTHELQHSTAEQLRPFLDYQGRKNSTDYLGMVRIDPKNARQIQLLANDSNFEILKGLITEFDQNAVGLAGSSAPATPLGAMFLTITTLLQTSIFIFSGFLIYKLWAMVLAALADKNCAKGKMLISLVGGIDASGETTASAAKVRGKLKGVGLLGTISIFAFACIAIYLLGRNNMF